MFLIVAQTLFFSESNLTPKTQPNDSRAAVWLSFWCSTRPSADTVTITTYYIIIIITELPEHIELLLFCFSSLNELNVLTELSDNYDDLIGCNSNCVCRRPS